MKKTFIFSLSILFSCFVLNSCDPWEDDSYHESTGAVELTGTWKLTTLNLTIPYDFNGDGTENTDLMVETNCYQNELMDFADDGTGISTSNSYADITIEGENFTTECIEETEETPFTWIQDQNNITITVDGQTLNAIFIGNTLAFTIPEGFFASDGEEGGVEILQDIIFTYTKVE